MQVVVEFVCFVTAFLPTVSNYVIQRSSEMVHDVKEFFDVRENFLGLSHFPRVQVTGTFTV